MSKTADEILLLAEGARSRLIAAHRARVDLLTFGVSAVHVSLRVVSAQRARRLRRRREVVLPQGRTPTGRALYVWICHRSINPWKAKL